MVFVKSGKRSEIQHAIRGDREKQDYLNAFTLASKPMCELIKRTLLGRGIKDYEFQNAAEKPGTVEIKTTRFKYFISLAIVPKEYNFKFPKKLLKHEKLDQVKKSMGLFWKYAEMMFEFLKLRVQNDIASFADSELDIDVKRSTMYIDEDCRWRVGFKIVEKIMTKKELDSIKRQNRANKF